LRTVTYGTGPQPPVAVTGGDTTLSDDDADGYEFAEIDATASYDPDGTIVEYEWKEEGSVISTSSVDILPFAVGSHDLVLTVTDNDGFSASTTKNILINPNVSPLADAGADTTGSDSDGDGIETVSLSGSASYDTDGSIVSFEWSIGTTTISSSESFVYGFPVGSFLVNLMVTDNGGAIDTDTVAVNISANTPPVAGTSGNVTVSDADGTGSELVLIDGSASYDPDGSIMAYEWSEDGIVLGTQEILLFDYSVGTHEIALKVTDNGGGVSTTTAIVDVIANSAPTADAGPDINTADIDGDGEEPVVLDGGNSFDSDGSIISYEWRIGGNTIGYESVLEYAFSVGSHDVTLWVTDNGNLSSSDVVRVEVSAGPTQITPLIIEGYSSLTQEYFSANGQLGNVLASDDIYIQVEGGNYASLRFEAAGIPEGSSIVSAIITIEHNEDPGIEQGDVLFAVGYGWPVSPQVWGMDSSAPTSKTDIAYSWDVTDFLTTAERANTAEVKIENLKRKNVNIDHVELRIEYIAGEMPNQHPVAVAGDDLTINDSDQNGEETVTLDGSSSYDPDGTISSYEWVLEGTRIGTTSVVSYDFPLGIHTVYLMVIDNEGLASSDEITVYVVQDVSGPFISETESRNVAYNSAEIHWTTDEASSSVVRYDTSDSFSSPSEVRNNTMVVDHVVLLEGLLPETIYYFEVVSADGYGNISKDDNDGQYHVFQTPNTANVIHVADIGMTGEVSIRGQNRFCSATAVVAVHDELYAAKEGVEVIINWSGALSLTQTGTTGTDGTAVFVSEFVKNCGEFTVTVDNLSLPGYVYDVFANIETEDTIIL